MLDGVLRNQRTTLPGALLRDRLALDAAAASLVLESRNESPSDIRDAVCLARAKMINATVPNEGLRACAVGEADRIG